MGKRISSRFRKLGPIARFWSLVDSEKVEPFQFVFYVAFIFIGFQDLFIAHSGPRTLHGTMNYFSVQTWCWCLMLGPTCGLVGEAIYRFETPGIDIYRPGRTLKLTGDIAIFVAIAAYTVATFHTEPWGTGGAGGYIGLAILLSMIFLILRDIRRFSEPRFRTGPKL